MSKYLELTDRRNQLLLPLFRGVKSAEKHLHIINSQLTAIEKNPKVFEPTFIHKKPGYTKPMLRALIAQACKNSIICEIDVRNYADWLIVQMSVCK